MATSLIEQENLLAAAKAAREMSYSPYSHYSVGAALLTDEGEIYTGCNIENSSFGATNCAERTAIFKAVSEGKRKFRAIAIVGGRHGAEDSTACTPCGICRQVMMEFCDPETFEIVLTEKTYLLKELLPMGFGPTSMDE